MPIRGSRLRPLVAVLAATALAAGLSACSTRFTMVQAAGAAPEAPALPAATGAGAARVIDDALAQTVLVVPPHPVGALAVYVHGSGQSQYTVLNDAHDAAVVQALVGHGYLVLAANAGGKAWGDGASVADYSSAIRTTMRQYRVRDVFLMAESMGGLATMQLAARLPEVRAVTAWYPVCDLRTMQHKPRFAAAIATAWAGGDRRAVSPVTVPRVPLMIWASNHDTVVSAAGNAARCAEAERTAGGSVDYVHTVGEHGDSSNFQPQEVLRFFTEHLSSRLIATPATPAPGRV